MNILIVSATQFEVKPLLELLKIDDAHTGLNQALSTINKVNTDVLITGIGMVSTAYILGKNSSKKYDLVINAGVCGSFQRSISLGDVVHVTSDTLSEMGAEDGNEFLKYAAMELPGESIFANHLHTYFSDIDQLKKVKGITVNTVHGNDSSISNIRKLYNPDVESMEGASFYACCSELEGNYTQIRAVSNYVEKRDKSKWQMPLAIKNLNDFLIHFIKNETLKF